MADPRSTAQRIADTHHRLEHDIDAWVATSDGDRPWLVPLSFIWHDGALVIATDARTRTGRGIAATSQVRIGLGELRDLVMIDGTTTIGPISGMTEDEVASYRGRHGSNPRTWADSVVRVRPTRMHAWREENELAGRLVMRDGEWLEG